MSEGLPTVSGIQQQWSSPRVNYVRGLLVVAVVVVLLNIMAVVVFMKMKQRQPSALPAMNYAAHAMQSENFVWNNLIWEKPLWPQNVQAAPQVQVRQVAAPKIELIAIVQRGNDVKAAVDAGNGMQYLYVGDQINGLQVKAIDVDRDRVELVYQGRPVILELP